MNLLNEPEGMLALSWKQPFGTAMLYGKIETRVWNTHYRGLVLICTSKLAYNEAAVHRVCGDELFLKMCRAMNKQTNTLDLDGYAIAVGRLIDSRPMKHEDEEKAFVKYRPDLFCHIYSDVKPIKPFKWKGSQGWKRVDKSIIDSIEYLNGGIV